LQGTARMRAVLITLLVAGCGEQQLVFKPLPPLVEPQARKPLREIVTGELGLAIGDHWIWDVQVRGFSIGRAELIVGEHDVQSRFHTSPLASAVANVSHELITIVDREAGQPLSSTEQLEEGGKARQFSTKLAGTNAHSFHTALGAIRTWARQGAEPGFLRVVHADQMFRIELEAPMAQQDQLRVDGRVIGPDADIALTIWLDAARIPVRMEARDGDDRVTAELIAD